MADHINIQHPERRGVDSDTYRWIMENDKLKLELKQLRQWYDTLERDLDGRPGTRRAWKRRHAPHYVMFFREPTDVLVIHDRTIIATPAQAVALQRAAAHT